MARLQVCTLGAALALIATACTGAVESEEPATTAARPSATVATTSAAIATAPEATAAPVGPCVPGHEPKVGIDLRYESIIANYNRRNAEGLIRIIGGDGPVDDPSVIPGRTSPFPSVAEWLAAAESVDDKLTDQGYGFGEPFAMFVIRSNDALVASGIESVFLTLEFWANQRCELRVSSGQIISSPDPCLFGELFGSAHQECAGSFDPRANHFAAWTGEEVLVFGGESGTTQAPLLTSALAYDPKIDRWRDIAPLPLEIGQWPTRKSVWTGEDLLVVGRTPHTPDNPETIVALSYAPDKDKWRTLAPLPEDRTAVGGVVWTGKELIIAGGDLHYPAADAWAYSPATDDWRSLPDPGFAPAEGVNAVWTGTEVFVFGGYPGPGRTPPAHAYDPSSGTWREATQPDDHWIDNHEITWTGDVAIVSSGHFGPGHKSTLAVYDPEGDEWRESAPMPILPAERQSSIWTGTELIIWGGLATYGAEPDADGDFVFGAGAAYDPATDTWRVIANSPLADRCDHSATWTGQRMVVFGGMLTCGDPGIVADGHAASYDPDEDSWVELER